MTLHGMGYDLNTEEGRKEIAERLSDVLKDIRRVKMRHMMSLKYSLMVDAAINNIGNAQDTIVIDMPHVVEVFRVHLVSAAMALTVVQQDNKDEWFGKDLNNPLRELVTLGSLWFGNDFDEVPLY